MRTLSLGCSLLLLAACSKPDAKVATDTATAAPMAAGATATPITLSELAGKWTMQTMRMTSDTVLVTYELAITPDGNGATLTFPGRPPIPARITPSGDSLIAEVGPYESALRKGVQVTTHSVFRLAGADLVGTGIARYSVTGPDSLLALRMKGTRAP